MKKIYLCLSLSLVVLLTANWTVLAQTSTYNYTGSVQTYVVPAGVTTIAVDVIGAQGGGIECAYPVGGLGYQSKGGCGGRVQATLNVTPGHTLNITVGGGGNGAGAGIGGYGGGGNSTWSTIFPSAGGGGGSTVFDVTSGTTLAIAGGGGGGGGDFCISAGVGASAGDRGGAGGGLIGAAGNANICGPLLGGQGGTQFLGGAASTCSGGTGGAAGTLGVGGSFTGGGSNSGGGGGGYYGGGAGVTGAGGGGGSSYTNPTFTTAVIHTQGYNCGAGGAGSNPGANGQVIISVACSAGTITGPGTVCTGSTIALTDLTAGGTWSASPVGVASVSPTGVVTGLTAGIATISYTVGGCSALSTVTVTALPSSILGTLAVCVGATTSLSDVTPGGTWSSGTPGVAGISGTGVVSGGASGTSVITYATGPSCYATAIVTVDPSPTAILGASSVCVGLTTILSDLAGGGTWSSSNTAVATVGSSTGIVTGVGIGGAATITYTLIPGNCYVTTPITVNPAPSAILGIPVVCQGLTTSLSDLVGGGSWSSSVPGVAGVSATGLVTGVSGGTSTIVYTSANCTPVSVVVTVNPTAPISGSPVVCAGTTITLSDAVAGGTWSSSATAVATIGSSSGLVFGITAGTSNIVYTTSANCVMSVTLTVNPSPVSITGTSSLCLGQVTTMSDATAGGTWSSSTPTVATIVPGSGFTQALGAGTTTLTYTLPAGCTATMVLTVNPLPVAISGNSTVCAGINDTLSDATTGGLWSTSNPGIATIVAGTGVATGVAPGTVTITYLLPTGCSTTMILTVNPSPVAIMGNHSMCVGLTTLLTDPTTGGTWSSSDPTVATIVSASGLATGITNGTSIITYTLSAGCTATTEITVNPVPGAINGTSNGCIGFTTTLTDASPGGTWSSSTPSIATIGSATGIVNAFSAGTTTMTYSLVSTGCYSTMLFTVNPPPAPISGAPYICEGSSSIFTDASSGGAWSSSNILIATVGSSSGVVNGVAAGTATITYTLSTTTCYRIYSLTITSAPTAITGPGTVCKASAVTLSDAVPGGTWSVIPGSGTVSVGASSGVVTGLTPGTAIVQYTTLACAPATRTMTINPLPAPINGPGSVCAGTSTTLSDITPGGVWSASGASVGSTGIVTGLSVGVPVTVTYTLPATGCYQLAPVSVSPVPDSIRGTDSICPGSYVVLSDSTTGGVWGSSDGTIAEAIAITGHINGLVPGNVTITYTLVSGCYTTLPMRVLTPLPAFLNVTFTPSDSALCHNTPVTLTPHPTNGGVPSYEWKLFGAHFSFDSILTYNPTHGDFLTCVMTTHSVCASPAIVAKDVVLNVWPLGGPIVDITCSQADTISYIGEEYTFYSLVTFGGPSPMYQWYINGLAVPGATLPVFTTRIYDDNEYVYCQVTGNSPCDTASFVGTSNGLLIHGLGYLSVGTISGSNDLRLFPNPNNGSFVLSGTISNTIDKEVTMEVVDMLGRTVYTGKTTPQNGTIRAEIKLEEAAGNYLLRVHTENGNETFHFVVGK